MFFYQKNPIDKEIIHSIQIIRIEYNKDEETIQEKDKKTILYIWKYKEIIIYIFVCFIITTILIYNNIYI